MLLKRTNVITALLVWVLLSGDILSEQDSTSPALRHIRRTGSQETAAVIVQGRPLLHTTQLFPLDASGKLVGVNDAVGQIDQLLKNLETLLARFEISTDQVVKLKRVVTVLCSVTNRRYQCETKPRSNDHANRLRRKP